MEQQERYDVSIRKMVKDKRYFVSMQEVNLHKFDKLDRM